MNALSSALSSGNFDTVNSSASGTPETEYLFFTQDEYGQLPTLIPKTATASASPQNMVDIIGILTKVSYMNELTLTQLQGSTASASAQQLSKSQCIGTNISNSTSSPVDNSRIQSATVSGQLAYYLPPQSGCSYQNITVIIDCGNTARPASCEFVFNNAPDINHLSPDQQALLQSIKVQ